MKFSILLTAYDPESKLGDMTAACVKSIEESSVGQDYELLVDTGPKGLFGAYNRLFKRAKGDYCVVVPNDTVIRDPEWLPKLAVPGTITSWHIGYFLLTGHREPDGGVTCYPRDVFDRVGEYDERFDAGYGYGDNDWFHRADILGVPLLEVPVRITHNGNTTYQTYYDLETRRTMTATCEALFRDKWGITDAAR